MSHHLHRWYAAQPRQKASQGRQEDAWVAPLVLTGGLMDRETMGDDNQEVLLLAVTPHCRETYTEGATPACYDTTAVNTSTLL